jgi:hypothetical protein
MIASTSISSIGNVAVIELAARNDLQVANPLIGLAPVMGLDEAEHDIHSPIAKLMRLFEHPAMFCLLLPRRRRRL